MRVKSLIIGLAVTLTAVFCITNAAARLWCICLISGNLGCTFKDRPESLVIKDKESDLSIIASEIGAYKDGECVGVFGTLGNFMPGKMQPNGILLVDSAQEANLLKYLAIILCVSLIWNIAVCAKYLGAWIKAKSHPNSTDQP